MDNQRGNLVSSIGFHISLAILPITKIQEFVFHNSSSAAIMNFAHYFTISNAVQTHQTILEQGKFLIERKQFRSFEPFLRWMGRG